MTPQRKANAPMTSKHDLDETRRLLYMALAVRRTTKYELAGTIVNALAHHLPDAIDPDEAMDQIIALIEDDDTKGAIFAREHIARLTRKIESWTAPVPPSAAQ